MSDLIASISHPLRALNARHRRAKHPGPRISRRTSCLECLRLLNEADPRLHAVANVLRAIDATKEPNRFKKGRHRRRLVG